MSAQLEGVEVLSFACYGTLVDRDRGVREAAAALPGLAGCDLDRFVRDHAATDRRLTRTGYYVGYGQVLRDGLREAAEAQGLGVTAEEARAFSASMGSWPPFAEAPRALARLAGRFRLAILSNVRTAVLERSVALLGAPFEELVTAEELHSYKPRPAHFEELLRRLRVPASVVLHVAGSPESDLAPAEALGWRDAWVNRSVAPAPEGIAPTLVVRDLEELCERLGVGEVVR